MLVFLIFIGILWLVTIIKSVLFWTYLWQLKEYHLKRFADHFRTAKGKELIWDRLRVIKLALLISFIFNPLVLFALTPLIYFLEGAKAAYDVYRRKLLKPIFTKKIIFIIIGAVTLEIGGVLILFKLIEERVWLSAIFFPLLLVIGDLLIPIIVSLIILALKPFTYLFVKRLLAKAKIKRESFKDLIVIGITGSYGKSSAKEFLYQILSEKYKVLKTEKNINAEVGIARTILDKLNSDHQVLIVEIGAYERGKIKEVCQTVRPNSGILTGINQQHQATFGSQENIIKGKFELIESLPVGGTAVLNTNSKLVESGIRDRESKLKEKKVLTIEVNHSTAKNILVERESLSFDLSGVGFKVNVLGKHNLDNILLATATAQHLGMSMEETAKACLKLKDKKMIKRSPYIIDTSYSANPDGVLADLEYLKVYSGRKAVVMPCLIELGKSSKEVHKKIGEKIEEICDLAIITTKDCFVEIQEKTKKAVFSDNPQEIAKKLESFKGKEDVVLIEGRVGEKIKKALGVSR